MGKKVSRFSITDMKGDVKLSKENAVELVKKACLKFDIDIDADYGISTAAGNRTEAMLSNIEDYLMRGILDIDTGSWVITHTLQDNYSDSIKTIEYKPVDGETMAVMDGIDKDNRIEMMFAMLGKASGLGPEVIKKLKGVDLKVAQVVLDFFI